MAEGCLEIYPNSSRWRLPDELRKPRAVKRHSMSRMSLGRSTVTGTAIDDYAAEAARLESILGLLTEEQWLTESGASGWSVADVVLHLAQSDEGVAASAAGVSPRGDVAAAGTVDDWAARMVDAERAASQQVFTRWRQARDTAVEKLRAADPQVPLQWVTGPLKPATLATTRLAEHWAHGLDITAPLGIDFPDTSRLRHIAWLAHRTLPYAFSLAGEAPAAVRCSLTAPDGVTVWTFGPDDAGSEIRGPAGAFCRVAARRLDAEASGLQATGPHGASALRVVRNYA
jgi:uncharacterized protein (TIGR03084 family)